MTQNPQSNLIALSCTASSVNCQSAKPVPEPCQKNNKIFSPKSWINYLDNKTCAKIIFVMYLSKQNTVSVLNPVQDPNQLFHPNYKLKILVN
ncbi:hypothetical protein HanIR_Chr09g0411971 [Helianthus annuus]|nr:hypothetical protein HanIR_Chr09g0411971 [Helianthus annuus]